MNEFHLSELFTDLTHFTEHTASTIDLVLVHNTANQCTVLDHFIPDQIRYHCPMVVYIKFTRPSTISFNRKIWNYMLADYDKCRHYYRNLTFVKHLQTDNDIDSNVQCISTAMLSAAENAIPNNVITVKLSDQPWVTCRIKQLIRKRKRTFRQ